MWCSTAWPSTRSKLSSANGSARRRRARRLDLEAELARALARERAEHPGRDVGARRLADHAGAQQVQGEVARAGADLQRAVVAAVGSRRAALRSFAEHLLVADLAEVDAPLGVVVAGRHVVVARVRRRGSRSALGRRHGRTICARARTSPCRRSLPVATVQYVQRNQPDGVPPLELTGERTLPDVPGRELLVPPPPRRLRVDRARGSPALRVIDMACGEGYGSDVLARSAAARRRRRRQPRGPRARAPALPAREPALRAGAGRDVHGEPALDAVVFLQTIEHVQDPVAVLEHFRSLLAPGGAVFVSTPERAHARARRAPSSSATRGTCTSTAPRSSRELCAAVFAQVELFGLFHARKLRAARARAALGWDSVHARLRLTKRFYDWFTPAIADQRLRAARRTGSTAALDFLAVCRA